MKVLPIEPSKAAYWADFAFYGITVEVLAVMHVLPWRHERHLGH